VQGQRLIVRPMARLTDKTQQPDDTKCSFEHSHRVQWQ
jgi:hypothetical protein